MLVCEEVTNCAKPGHGPTPSAPPAAISAATHTAATVNKQIVRIRVPSSFAFR
jgi:hypothetical protein